MSNIVYNELIEALKRSPLVATLGWHDIRARYRRSLIGPFWLTISMGVMIASIGIVFGRIFKTPMEEYLPFLASGIIFWTFLSSSIIDGSSAFINAHGMIRQLALPLHIHTLRVLWRNIIILIHNILILPVVFLVIGKSIGLEGFRSLRCLFFKK